MARRCPLGNILDGAIRRLTSPRRGGHNATPDRPHSLSTEASMSDARTPAPSRTSIGRRRFLGTALAAAATASAASLARPHASHGQGGTLVVTSYGGPWEQFM